MELSTKFTALLQNLTRSPPHWFTDNSTIKGLYSIDIFYCDSLYLQRELKFQCVLYDFTIPSAHISFYIGFNLKE